METRGFTGVFRFSKAVLGLSNANVFSIDGPPLTLFVMAFNVEFTWQSTIFATCSLV